MCFKEIFPKSNIKMSNRKEKKEKKLKMIESFHILSKKKKNHFTYFLSNIKII